MKALSLMHNRVLAGWLQATPSISPPQVIYEQGRLSISLPVLGQIQAAALEQIIRSYIGSSHPDIGHINVSRRV